MPFRPSLPRRGRPPARERKVRPKEATPDARDRTRRRVPRDPSVRRPLEADWLGGEPGGMLRCLADFAAADPPAPAPGPRSVERKVRLFYCACARLLGAPDGDVAVVEAYADRTVPARLVRRMREDAARELGARLGSPAAVVAVNAAGVLIQAADVHRALRERGLGYVWAVHSPVQTALLRDLLDDPFRPVDFDRRWRTADVLGVARAVYDNRAFDRLPLLADALMDAGCADERVIGHCRGEGPHVRGCWVVDRALGLG